MDVVDALKKRRSVRRFTQEPIQDSVFLEIVAAAAVAPSAANALPLRYVVVRTQKLVKEIFELAHWGGHVKPNRDPVWGESSPVAFIAVCAPLALSETPITHADAGAAIQSMLLRAVELKLACCWLGAFDKPKTDAILKFKDMSCLYLVAVGGPGESPAMETIKSGQSTKYYLDGNDVLHVPKYCLDSVCEFR